MFHISTYLPRIDRVAKTSEFTNSHHFNLSKFFYNNDSEGIKDFFDNTIYDLLINKEIYKELTCIEKFSIWLNLYYNCIDDKLSIQSISLNDFISVNIKDILKRVPAIECDEKIIKINKDISITLNAPYTLLLDKPEDIVSNLIYTIASRREIYYFNNFTADEKTKFLSTLPANIFDSIMGYYQSLDTTLDIMPQTEKVTFEPIEISPINGNMFAFLKSIYKVELSTHYSNIVAYMKYIGGDNSSYFSMTHRDFYGIYKTFESVQKTEKTT